MKTRIYCALVLAIPHLLFADCAPTGLVALWKGQSNVLDSAGGFDGTKGGGVTYTDAEVGKGFSFNGTLSANLDLGTFLNFGTSDFTVEFWIKTTTTDSARRTELIGKRGGCDDQSSFFDIQLQTNGVICFNFNSAGRIGYIDMASTNSINDGAFHHVACVRQGTNALVYIDGTLNGTQNPADAQIAIISNINHLKANSGPCIANLDYAYFNGCLDEISVYTNALSASDILAVYQDGTNGKPSWAPNISDQPVTPQNVHTNSGATFTVTALGSPAASYQWRLNTTNTIVGATNSSYTIAQAQSTDLGTYDVIVSNSCGTVTSDGTSVLVFAPVITTQPANTNGVLGSPAYFSVVVGGSPTISYQWRKNGTAINDGVNYAGTTTANLTVKSVASGSHGTYSVHVSNDGGVVNSSNTNGILSTVPAITVQPTSKSGFINGSVTFTVTATGSPTLMYQWMANNVTISGATKASYTLSNISSNWQGYVYTVQVTNQLGAITSDGTATLSVKGTVLTDIPEPLTTTKCPGDTRELCVTGGAATNYVPTYQWKHGGTAIPGATDPCYTVNVTDSSAAGNYTCVVSDPFGSDTSSAATIVYDDPAAITLNPLSQTAIIGNPTHFFANASGTSDSYAWIKDGVVIATGITNYTITNTGALDAGTYYFQAANLCDTANSSNAVLTVTNSSGCASNLLTGLIAWWQFESNLLDFTTNYSSTNVGTGISYSTGKVNTAIQLDGTSNAWADLGAFTNFGTSDFTVEFWIKTTTSDPTYRVELMSKRDVCGHSKFFDIQLQTNGAICFNYDGESTDFGPGVGYIDMASATPVADGVFHHVACVRQGTNALVYIDGSLNATQNPADAQIASISNTADLQIGLCPCVGHGYTYFTGSLDELAIYNRALSADEIAAIFNAASMGKCTGP